ncbi:MAG TPA: hypothetical protein VH394_25055, partial [Thermoanaerobaculia bacterium]|nr:hypothetical protein [Thermoanaerobaculia bacterium]
MPKSIDNLPAFTKEEEYEFETYIRSFTTASDRVRHVIFVSLIASILAFAAHRNSMHDGWMYRRIDLARLFQKEHLAIDGENKVVLCRAKITPLSTKSTEEEKQKRREATEHCNDLESAIAWFQGSGHSLKSFQYALAELERAKVAESQIVEVPFLGIEFDINDLGTFSSIGLSIIAIVLCYSMARHHENLFLCLWKVRRLGESEARYNDGQSKANFLYHALAMAQVFSRPPTLARWGKHYMSRIAPVALFFVPVAVQIVIFSYDLASIN